MVLLLFSYIFLSFFWCSLKNTPKPPMAASSFFPSSKASKTKMPPCSTATSPTLSHSLRVCLYVKTYQYAIQLHVNIPYILWARVLPHPSMFGRLGLPANACSSCLGVATPRGVAVGVGIVGKDVSLAVWSTCEPCNNLGPLMFCKYVGTAYGTSPLFIVLSIYLSIYLRHLFIYLSTYMDVSYVRY